MHGKWETDDDGQTKPGHQGKPQRQVIEQLHTDQIVFAAPKANHVHFLVVAKQELLGTEPPVQIEAVIWRVLGMSSACAKHQLVCQDYLSGMSQYAQLPD